MRNRILFSLVALGIVAGVVSAYVYARPKHPLPPAFNPAPNPYGQGIYANGIVESYQLNGENVNLYPEVAGTITKILVAEGQTISRGRRSSSSMTASNAPSSRNRKHRRRPRRRCSRS